MTTAGTAASGKVEGIHLAFFLAPVQRNEVTLNAYLPSTGSGCRAKAVVLIAEQGGGRGTIHGRRRSAGEETEALVTWVRTLGTHLPSADSVTGRCAPGCLSAVIPESPQ